MKSWLKNKKLVAIVIHNFSRKINRKGKVSYKAVHFGAKGYEDYTTHKNPTRKLNYIVRHYPGGSDEDWDDINTAGFWLASSQ